MSLIKKIWDKAIEVLDEEKKKRRLKALKLQGEISIRKKNIELENAKDNLEQVIIRERDKTDGEPSFDLIADANEKMKIAEEKLKLASEMFKEFFGVEPEYSE